MLKLDPNKTKLRQLTNDAFFWLYSNEEPIDEDNLEEAYEILEMFPEGFKIGKWEYVEDDCIEAEFIPYIQCKEDIIWNGEHRTKRADNSDFYCGFKFKIINPTTCFARWVNDNNGKIIFEGNCNIIQINGKPWAVTPSNSKIPLWGKNIRKI